MGSRKKIIGSTSWARSSLGIHPVGMKKAVISPHARNAPMFGITIPARKPPNLWTLARHPPVAGVGTGIAVDIRGPPFSSGYARSVADPRPVRASMGSSPTRVRRITSSRQHDLDVGLLESETVRLRESAIADQHVEIVDSR